jgi:hypothetical protein
MGMFQQLCQRRWKRALSLAALGLLYSLAMKGHARAAGTLEVDWQTPECASVSEFRARLAAALERPVEAVLSGVLHLRVSMGEDTQASGFALHVEMDHEGSPLSRDVTAASCDEAVEAAALIVALALDSLDAPAQAPERAREREPEALRKARALLPFLSAQAGVSTAELPAPTLQFSAGAGLDVARFRIGAEGMWLASQRAYRSDKNASGQRVGGEIGLSGGGMSLCYLPVAGKLTLATCLLGQAGQWRSHGLGVSTPRTQRALWLAAGARVALAYRVSKYLALSLATDLQVPSKRPEFRLDELGSVYRAGPLGVRVSAGFMVPL